MRLLGWHCVLLPSFLHGWCHYFHFWYPQCKWETLSHNLFHKCYPCFQCPISEPQATATLWNLNKHNPLRTQTWHVEQWPSSTSGGTTPVSPCFIIVIPCTIHFTSNHSWGWRCMDHGVFQHGGGCSRAICWQWWWWCHGPSLPLVVLSHPPLTILSLPVTPYARHAHTHPSSIWSHILTSISCICHPLQVTPTDMTPSVLTADSIELVPS